MTTPGERLPEESRKQSKNKDGVCAFGLCVCVCVFFKADTRVETGAGHLKGRVVLVDVKFLHEVTRREYIVLFQADGGRKDELTCC